MRTEITYISWIHSGSKSKLANISISGEIVKETAKQLVIQDENTLALNTINKSKIIKRYDYKELF